MNDTETVRFHYCAYATNSVSALRCHQRATKKLVTDVQKHISELGNKLALKHRCGGKGSGGFGVKCGSAYGQ
jgi:hypothetical protein